MKISELKDKQGKVNIDLKVIWDMAKPKQMFGKTIKEIIVADIESQQGDPTAYLDVYNDDCEKFKQGDKIRVTDAYSKLIQGKSQFRLTNSKRIELIETSD